jgi:hypothetical protein
MSQSQLKKSRNQNEFDTIIIGGGLGGLLLAKKLLQTGRKIALLEGRETTGGTSRGWDGAIGNSDYGLKFIPNSPVSAELLEWLSQALGEDLGAELIGAPPMTFDNGKFQPFVGFGDFHPEANDALQSYLTAEHWNLKLTPKDWVGHLSESLSEQIHLQSQVSQLVIEEGLITSLIINGSKKMHAREVIFCGPPRELGQLLSEETISARNRQRLLKSPYFTSVHLDIVHSHLVTDSPAIHILKGANEEPNIGQFHPAQTLSDGSVTQLSQWLTFIPADLTDDAELTAGALKQIKRQLKRPYPTALDQIRSERILIQPASHGQCALELTPQQTLGKIKNLWVSSSFFGSERGVLGTLAQAQSTFVALTEQNGSHHEDLPLNPAEPAHP